MILLKTRNFIKNFSQLICANKLINLDKNTQVKSNVQLMKFTRGIQLFVPLVTMITEVKESVAFPKQPLFKDNLVNNNILLNLSAPK